MGSADLTDEEIRAAYSAASRGSYDAINVMAGYRAIIAADRKLRGVAQPAVAPDEQIVSHERPINSGRHG